MKWQAFKTVQARLLLFLILIGIIPSIIIAVQLLKNGNDKLIQVEKQLSSEAELTATVLEQRFTIWQREATLVADLLANSAEFTSLQKLRTTYYPEYTLLAHFDADGKIVNSDPPLPAGSSAETIVSFQTALQGKQTWEFAPSAPNGEQMLQIYTPIRASTGEVNGVLASPVSIKTIETLVNGHAEVLRFALVDQKQQLILNPHTENSAEAGTIYPPFAKLLETQNATKEQLRYRLNGINYVAGYAVVNNFNGLLLAEEDSAELYATTNQQRNTILGITALTMLGGILAAYFASRALIAPPRELADAAQAFAYGDADIPLPAPTTPQYANLIKSFENMRTVVTEREGVLSQSEARNRALLEALPDTLFRLNRNGTIIDFHAPSRPGPMRQMDKNMIGVDFYQFIKRMGGTHTYNITLQAFKRAVQTGEPQTLECQLTIYSKPTDFEVRFTPLEENNEVLAIFRNVTRRKQDANLIRKQGLAIEAAHDGMAILDKQLKLTYLNPAFASINGYKSADLLGRALFELYPNSEQDHFNQLIIPHVKTYGSWRGEMLGRTKNNEQYPQEISLSLLPDSGEIVCVVRDITPHKVAVEQLHEQRQSLKEAVRERTAELEAANTELAQAARLKDEFLANMSHELRTPLNSILGMTEALQEEIYGSLSDQQRQAVQRAEESAQHLLDVINDVLHVSQIEAGKIDLKLENISAETVCEASLAIIRHSSQKKGLKVYYQFDPQIKEVTADERRLKQILVNLLSNAVKFTPNGGKIGLEVRGDLQKEVVIFTVWDTGIGIAEDEQTLLFKPFVQLDGSLSRIHEGSGLGLAISQRLAEMLGGEIHLQSEVGKGSHFALILPWVNEKEATIHPQLESSAENVADNPLITNDPLHAPLILLAEDNELSIVTFADYLRYRGYRVMVARTGVETIDLAKRNHPDLILMDVQMPIMDGIETTRRLRRNTLTAKTPIIALTGLAMEGDEERCLAVGANGYLTKPVGLKVLVNTIQHYLGQPLQA